MGASTRITTRLLAGLLLVAGAGGGRAAAQTPDQLLARKPVQPGVPVTTPTGADLAGCKAEPKNWGGGTTGAELRDAGGRLVRRFVATPTANIASFYLNGVEAYRETDTNKDDRPGHVSGGSARTAASGARTRTATASSTSGTSSPPRN